MLTPEDRQRIEEEERKRAAEDQYRAEVREKLRQHSPSRDLEEEEERRTPIWKIALGAICVVVFLVVGINIFSNSRSGGLVAINQNVVSGQIVVKSESYIQYRFRVTPDMRDVHLSGKFSASGGSGNDIEVVLANEDEFANWINGHVGKVFYSTQGKKTTDHFDVPLGPGTYVLAFNNRFSAITDKSVVAQVDLKFSQPRETNP